MHIFTAMGYNKFRIFFVCVIVIFAEYLGFLWYMEIRNKRPLTVQVLQKAERLALLKPAVSIVKNTLVEVFGAWNTKKVLKITKHTTKEVAIGAEYSTLFALIMLGGLFLALNVLIYKRRWFYYTVEKGDTTETILSRFTMTEASLLRSNPFLRKLPRNPSNEIMLPGGLHLKVRNRHFIEKDYLHQLQDALKLSSSHFPDSSNNM